MSDTFGRLRGRFRARSVEPSTALFRQIRWRLTAWYTLALAITLLILGVALYLGVRSSLLGPVDANLQQSAQALGAQWQLLPGAPCSPEGHGSVQLFVACFDQNGHLIGGSRLAAEVGSFTDPSIVNSALESGSASDTINSHSIYGDLRRYAVRVPVAQGNGVQGVLEMAIPVGDRETALSTLLTRLLIFGGLGLVFAALGGLFLAGRSLAPARLAYVRQRDFIADASHELRTPLTMLRAGAEVLLRDRRNLQPDQVAILQDVVLEASHMTSLANNMLDLARLDGGEIHLEKEVVDLNQLGHDLARRLGPLAAERDVSIWTEDAGPVLVVGDRLLLEHAALILADNGIKYNRPGGRVTFRAHLANGSAGLDVQDTGIGIATEHVLQLGERFFRVDKARSRAEGGAGLGVSIARFIAARHDGSLHWRSEPGVGTVATLVLPAAQGSAAPTEQARAAAAGA